MYNQIIPIESIELGYFALNPMTGHSRDILYKILILNQLKSKSSWHIRDINHEISKKIALPYFKLKQIIELLSEDEIISANHDNLSITPKGKNYLTKIETDVSSLLSDVKDQLRQQGLNEEEIISVMEILDFLATRDSGVISSLLRIKDENLFLETEKEGLEYIHKKLPNLKPETIGLINNVIVENTSFKKLFLFLVYGHIAEYLLLTSSNTSLNTIFDNIKKQANEIKILIDTNAFIGLICHYDRRNFILNSLLQYLKEQDVGIKLLYHNKTINELKHTLKSFERDANKIQNENVEFIQQLIKDKYIFQPLKAFYFENKYRDWNHYIYLFMEAWKSYVNYYGFTEINDSNLENISEIEKTAKKDSSYLLYDKNSKFAKPPKVLEHDILLIHLANELAEKHEKESIIKNILILTLDSNFESLERDVMYLHSGITKRSINLRQLVAYLSPIFSLKENHLEIQDKILYGSLIKDEKMIQSIIRNVIKNKNNLGIMKTSRNPEYEVLRANTALSKEAIFSRSQKENEEVIK